MNYNEILNYLEINKDESLTELYTKLIKENDINLINFIFYDKYNYEYKPITEQIPESTEEKVKRYDNKFKQGVKDYYKTCIITGRSQLVCEVAHIYPFSNSNLDEKYDKYNGILLCRDLHKLFDDKLIKINPENFVLSLCEQILQDETLRIYHQYNNKILNINSNSKIYLKKLYS
jgi:predicted restriction endonuclease